MNVSSDPYHVRLGRQSDQKISWMSGESICVEQ